MASGKLTPRQQTLRNFLEEHFVPGKYFTIEEICNANIGYVLNKNPKIHDKCITLSNDIRAINWTIVDRYKIIIKNRKGACKLAESEQEFNAWKKEQEDKLQKQYQYLNNLKWKSQRDGTVPIVNLNNRALSTDETKVVDTYKRS